MMDLGASSVGRFGNCEILWDSSRIFVPGEVNGDFNDSYSDRLASGVNSSFSNRANTWPLA